MAPLHDRHDPLGSGGDPLALLSSAVAKLLFQESSSLRDSLSSKAASVGLSVPLDAGIEKDGEELAGFDWLLPNCSREGGRMVNFFPRSGVEAPNA